MVESIIKKIMVTGITKYAKIYSVSDADVQIKVTNNENGTVNFTMCKSYKPVEDVSFLQIMDKKMDLLQYEAIATPYMKQSLINYAKETNDELSNVCSFIVKIKDKLVILYYNGYKLGRHVTLREYLTELGL